MSYDNDRDRFDYHHHTSRAGAARAGRNRNARAGSYQGAAACVPLPCALWNESGMNPFPSWTTGNTGARRLVHECCNYDCGNCIALDDGEECVCVQSISYSLLCRWFQAAVLLLDKELVTALLYRLDAKRCAVCGALFRPGSNRAKYCPDCAVQVRRKKEAERQRKRYHDSTHLGLEKAL